jgi:hypothetical protein
MESLLASAELSLLSVETYALLPHVTFVSRDNDSP